ncbi:MAG: cupin domain-containing protein [Nocardioides sp.]|nr:cupin domain-containing protein [Nocardioides sp.]
MDASIDWSDLPVHAPIPGITGQVRLGAELSAALFRLSPGAVVPRHHHVNEEFGQVLEGSLELEVDAEVSRLAVGDSFLIPGNVPHAAVAGADGCLLLECYAPPRNPFLPAEPGASS